MNEYETTISHVTVGHDKDQYVHIETSEKTVISALEGKPDRFEKVYEDNTPGLPRLVKFRIPVTDVNWAALGKRRGTPRPNLPEARTPSSTDATTPSVTEARR